jgi:hypothetical protein
MKVAMFVNELHRAWNAHGLSWSSFSIYVGLHYLDIRMAIEANGNRHTKEKSISFEFIESYKLPEEQARLTVDEMVRDIQEANKRSDYPKYAKAEEVCLRWDPDLRKYIRDAGAWDTKASFREGRLIATSDFMDEAELIECSEAEWRRDNKGYV